MNYLSMGVNKMDWKKEFTVFSNNKNYCSECVDYGANCNLLCPVIIPKIQSFIENLLAEERKKIVEEIIQYITEQGCVEANGKAVYEITRLRYRKPLPLGLG